MKTQYEINGWTKHAEEDNWENGCIADSGFFSEGYEQFIHEDLNKLVDILCSAFGAERDAVTLNSCEEDGRIDLQVMENEDGIPASKPEMEAFKKGKCRLWLVDYIFRVELVTRKNVKLVLDK